MNILLAFIALTAAALWDTYGVEREPLHENVLNFFFTGGWLNIVLALFNLLPVPPLDGASVLMGLSFRAYRFYQQPQMQMIGMFVLFVLLIGGFGLFVNVAQDFSISYIEALYGALP